MTTFNTAKAYILAAIQPTAEQVANGVTSPECGCGTIDLYGKFYAREANAAIRSLLDEGMITISPGAYYICGRCASSSAEGVKQALRKRNFDIKLA